MNRFPNSVNNIDDQSETADLTLICPHLGDGGVQRIVSTLANEWSRNGRRVSVITLYDEEAVYQLDAGVLFIRVSDHPLVKKFEHIMKFFDSGIAKVLPFVRKFFNSPNRSEEGRLLRFFKFISYPLFLFVYFPMHIRVWVLRTMIKKTEAPVVISFCGSTNIMTVLAARSLPCRVIISERNDPARQKLRFPWGYLRERYYNGAHVVTANTHGALEVMQSYVDLQKLEYVPNPVFQPNLNAEHVEKEILNGPTVLIVGRLHHQKAHDVLLDAFTQLTPKLSEWKLSVLGQGDQEQILRNKVQALGMVDRVIWHGQVKDPFPFYQKAEIFVLPSRHEGTPNALLEAMSCGMAVIISDASSGPLELIEDGKTGIVVPVNDPTSLARAIERLADNAELRAALGRAALDKVSEYSLPRTLRAWERLIGWKSVSHVAESLEDNHTWKTPDQVQVNEGNLPAAR